MSSSSGESSDETGRLRAVGPDEETRRLRSGDGSDDPSVTHRVRRDASTTQRLPRYVLPPPEGREKIPRAVRRAPEPLGYTTLGLPPLSAANVDKVFDVLYSKKAKPLYDLLELHLTRPVVAPSLNRRLISDEVAGAVLGIAQKTARRGGEIILGLGARYLLSAVKHEPSLVSQDTHGRALRVRLIEEAIDLAADVGATAVIFLSGPSRAARDPQKYASPAWKFFEAGIERLLQRAEERDVVLAPEAHSSHLFSQVADLERLRSRFPSPYLGFTADTVHQTLSETRPLREVYRELAPYITHVQLDNTAIHRDEFVPGRSISHLPLYEPGEVDLAGAILGLREGGYSGPISVEFLGQDFPDLDHLTYAEKVGIWLRRTFYANREGPRARA